MLESFLRIIFYDFETDGPTYISRKIQGGRSNTDQITIFDSKYEATAFRCKNGDIKVKCKKRQKFDSSELSVFLTIFVIHMFKAFVIKEYVDCNTIFSYLYLIPCLFYAICIIAEIVEVKKFGMELAKNHGAEHMVIAAYEDLQKTPTVNEARNYSRISGCCGGCILTSFIVVQIIGFIVYKFLGYQINEIYLFVVSIAFCTNFPLNLPGKLLQFLVTTKEPEDCNIELAITAMNYLKKI